MEVASGDRNNHLIFNFLFLIFNISAMPLVFAAIAPHPPVLIPEIGQDNLKKLKKTKAAVEKLESELYAAKPESILIISPHGQVMPEAFNINLSPNYQSDFKEFGDFGLMLEFKSDYMAIQNIRAGDETQKKVNLVLTSQPSIDHGFSVPLYYLTKHFKNLPIIPVTPAELDYQKHFQFGEFLNQRLAVIDKRVAVIASADLSHKLTKDAPAGYSKKGAEFDQRFLALLKKNEVKGILALEPKLVSEAGVCGLRSIIILLGLISSMSFKSELLSYEGPFGVGYAVVNFNFQ